MPLKIAIAQVVSLRGRVKENITKHIQAIKRASELKISYLVFPELSLTGYEPDLASKLAFSESDARLKPLIDASIKYNIHIAVGAPLKSEELPKIGLIMIDTKGELQTYQKMHLHGAEENYFSPGNKHHLITLNDTKIANAICADTNNAGHCQKCVELGASVYVASSMITDGGYKADTDKLQAYAKEHDMLIALANYSASTIPFTGGWAPIGKSAFWTNNGLLVCANKESHSLVIAEKKMTEKGKYQWFGEVVDFD